MISLTNSFLEALKNCKHSKAEEWKSQIFSKWWEKMEACPVDQLHLLAKEIAEHTEFPEEEGIVSIQETQKNKQYSNLMLAAMNADLKSDPRALLKLAKSEET